MRRLKANSDLVRMGEEVGGGGYVEENGDRGYES
jgi:hypothetical protein